MDITQSNNKRIAKNTFFLYIRMFFVLVIGLFTSRVVLQALGEVDYGIYSVIGGVVAFLGILNSCLGAATQRFLNFDLGINDIDALKKDFSVSLNLYILLSGFVLVLAETIGLWFVNSKLQIPVERMFAVNLLYQFTVFTTVVSILQAPYISSIIAHERMSIYSWMSILEVFLKLLVSIVVLFVDADRLVLYGILLFGIYLFIALCYYAYSKKSFVECRFRLTFEKDRYYKVFSYSGWNVLGSSANIAATQGANVLLNLFFGPIVNASRGLSMQISGMVTMFFSNVYTAVRPQIVKLYASNELEKLYDLILTSVRFSFYLAILIVIPLYFELPVVVKAWLGIVPEYLVTFARLTIICCLIDCLSNPLVAAALASTNIRNYQIVVSLVNFLNLPISYMALLLTNNPLVPFYVAIIISFIALLTRALFVERIIGMKIWVLFKPIVFVLAPITLISIVPPYLVINYFHEGYLRVIITSMVSISFMAFVICLFGISTKEREILKNFVYAKIRKSK